MTFQRITDVYMVFYCSLQIIYWYFFGNLKCIFSTNWPFHEKSRISNICKFFLYQINCLFCVSAFGNRWMCMRPFLHHVTYQIVQTLPCFFFDDSNPSMVLYVWNIQFFVDNYKIWSYTTALMHWKIDRMKNLRLPSIQLIQNYLKNTGRICPHSSSKSVSN